MGNICDAMSMQRKGLAVEGLFVANLKNQRRNDNAQTEMKKEKIL